MATSRGSWHTSGLETRQRKEEVLNTKGCEERFGGARYGRYSGSPSATSSSPKQPYCVFAEEVYWLRQWSTRHGRLSDRSPIAFITKKSGFRLSGEEVCWLLGIAPPPMVTRLYGHMHKYRVPPPSPPGKVGGGRGSYTPREGA